MCKHEAAVAARQRHATPDVVQRAVLAGESGPLYTREWVVCTPDDFEGPANVGGVKLEAYPHAELSEVEES